MKKNDKTYDPLYPYSGINNNSLEIPQSKNKFLGGKKKIYSMRKWNPSNNNAASYVNVSEKNGKGKENQGYKKFSDKNAFGGSETLVYEKFREARRNHKVTEEPKGFGHRTVNIF